jgi:DNA-directed RNA polymerase subunit RPC12/RpoP
MSGEMRLRGLSPEEKAAFPDARCVVIIDGEESKPVSEEVGRRMIAEADLREFGDLAGHNVVGPVRFQGGVILLRGYGCRNCGNAFWVEDDDKRRLPPGAHSCPHCGVKSVVAEVGR